MAQTKRPVTIRGENWMFYVQERWRGEAAFDCADDEFVKRSNAASPE
jgi:hypothetical protein